MSLDVTSLAIQVSSTGIAEAAKGLDGLVTAANKAEKAFPGLKVAAENLSATQKTSVDAITKLLDKLQKQADLLGKNQAATNAYNAEMKGATQVQIEQARSIGETVDKHNAAVRALKEHEAAAKKAAGSVHEFSLVTAGSTRELLVLTHELVQGNFSRIPGSLIVMAERINFLPKAFAAVTGYATALGVSLGVLLTTVGALVAALVAVSFSAYKAHDAFFQMQSQIVLTGNFAGTTANKLNEMSNKIGNSTGHLGDARDAIIKLTASGKFTEDQIGKIGEAAVNMSKYANVSIEDTIKQFEKLAAEPIRGAEKGFQGISKGAVELDNSLHFLNPSILDNIMKLERMGDIAGASQLAIESLSKETLKRTAEIASNMTWFGQQVDTTVMFWKNKWNSLFTKPSDKDALKEKMAELATMPDDKQFDVWRAKLVGEVDVLQKKMLADHVKANADKIRNNQDTEAKDALLDFQALHRKIHDQDTLQEALKRNAANEQATRLKTPNSDFLSDSEMAARRLQLVKDFGEKVKKERSDGLTDLTAQIKKIEEVDEVTKRQYANELTLIELNRKYKFISEDEAFEQKEKILKAQYILINDEYNKELEAANNFHTKTSAQANEKAALMSSILIKQGKLLDDNTMRQEEAFLRLKYSTGIAAAAEQKAYETSNKQIENNITKIEDKINAYKRLPEAIQAAGISDKQLQDSLTEAQIARLELDKLEDTLSQKQIDQINNKINLLKEEAAIQRVLEGIQQKNTNALGAPARAKADALAQADIWKTTASTIEKALTNAFGNAGKAAGAMFKAYAEGQATQIKITQQVAEARVRVAKGDQSSIETINTLQAESATARMNEYGNIAGAAASFFDSQSKGYRTLMAVSQVFHAAEIALTIATNIQKGIGAVLNQGNGDPYSAFGRMAAMAAIVVGLGVAIAGGGSSGPSAVDRQASQGTGSVFGDDKAKSDSIAKSITIMEKNSGFGLAQGNDMVKYLKNLSDNIDTFASLVTRDLDLGNSSSITSTKSQSFAQSFASGISPIQQMLDPWAKITASIPILNTIISGLFGTKTDVVDQGLTSQRTTLGGLQSNGINLQQYQDTHSTSKFFGITVGSSDNRQTQAVSKEINDQIKLIIEGMAGNISAYAKVLGVSGDAFTEHLKTFIIDIGSFSTKGLTGEQVQKQLQNLFSKIADDMAKFALGDFQKFQKVGEGYFETLARVANDLLQVKDVFTVLGKTITATGIDAVNTSEALIAAAGGLENLTKGTKYFVDNFLTADERLKPIAESVANRLTELGQSNVNTIVQYKQLVQQQDLNTASGQNMYAALISLAPAFKMVVDAADEAAEASKNAAKEALALHSKQLEMMLQIAIYEGRVADADKIVNEQREIEIATLDVSLVALQRRINSIEDEKAALQALENTVSVLVAAIDRYNNALNNYKAASDAVAAAQTTITTSLRTLGDAVKSFADKASTAQAAVDTARDAISAAYFSAQDAVAAAQQKIIDITNQSGNALRQLSIDIQKFLDSLKTTTLGSGNPESQYKALQIQFDRDAQAGKTAEAIKDATDLLTASKGFNASSLAFVADETHVKEVLAGLQANADMSSAAIDTAVDPMVAAQRDLYIAQTNLNEIMHAVQESGASTDRSTIKIANSASNLLAAFNKAQVDNLKAQENYKQALLLTQGMALTLTDDLTGLRTSVDNYTQGLTSLQTATANLASAALALASAKSVLTGAGVPIPANGTPISTGPGSTSGLTGATTPTGIDEIEKLYFNILGRAPDAPGLNFWENAYNQHGRSAESLRDITTAFYNSPEYVAFHGSHANGLESVPFDGYIAKLHKGEKVQTASAANKDREATKTNEEIRELLKALAKNIMEKSDGSAPVVKKLDEVVKKIDEQNRTISLRNQTGRM